MPTQTYSVPNISCGHCVDTIKRELGEAEGIISVAVDQQEKRVTVNYEAPASPQSIVSLLTEINFPPH